MRSMVANTVSHCQEAELAVLQHRLQALEESRKVEAQVAEQLQLRQEELSRTRAQVSSTHALQPYPLPFTLSPPTPLPCSPYPILQVSSLSIELTGEKKMTTELRSQLTLSRAEAARYQAQVEHSHCD